MGAVPTETGTGAAEGAGEPSGACMARRFEVVVGGGFMPVTCSLFRLDLEGGGLLVNDPPAGSSLTSSSPSKSSPLSSSSPPKYRLSYMPLCVTMGPVDSAR